MRHKMRFGNVVWTRQLVSRETDSEGLHVRVFFAGHDKPCFRCSFIREMGDKHILVRGGNGREYTVHKCYAGKNPACTVSFDGFYTPARPEGVSLLRHIRHKKGTSLPDASTEVLFLRQTFSHGILKIFSDRKITL